MIFLQTLHRAKQEHGYREAALFRTLENVQGGDQVILALYFALMQAKDRGCYGSIWLEYGDRFSVFCNHDFFPCLVYFIHDMETFCLEF